MEYFRPEDWFWSRQPWFSHYTNVLVRMKQPGLYRLLCDVADTRFGLTATAHFPIGPDEGIDWHDDEIQKALAVFVDQGHLDSYNEGFLCPLETRDALATDAMRPAGENVILDSTTLRDEDHQTVIRVGGLVGLALRGWDSYSVLLVADESYSTILRSLFPQLESNGFRASSLRAVNDVAVWESHGEGWTLH